jgi:3-deoxy-D-manno-octulosonic-acid transferase
MMMVYSSLLLAVLVVGAPYWLVRMATSGRYRAGLQGRLGRVPAALRSAVAGRDVIWVHAVSVGEVMAAIQLIRELKTLLPGWVVVVSTTTETGQRLAAARLGSQLDGSPVFYLPLDFKFAVRRYLAALKPQLLILMESELWPRLIEECTKAGVAVAVVNARISDRSFPRYLRLRSLWKPFLEMISLFLAQSAETAERLVKIGAPAERIKIMGNLKYDTRPVSANAMKHRLEAMLAGSRLIVAGSTLAGEEEALLAAWPAIRQAAPDTLLLIAPRHPDRFDEIMALIQTSASPSFRCSQLTQSDRLPPGSILLLDTIGDLASVYAIASVAFVGGSLVPKGGHNPLEPAQFGVPVVMGPSFENFREVVGALQAHDAIRMISSDQLATALIAMLQDIESATAQGERGRLVFASQAGATARTVQALTQLLAERTVARR